MPFDEFSVNHCGMTGSQARSNAEARLDLTHVGFDMFTHAEAMGFKILEPLLAAAPVRISVNVDDFGSLCHSGHMQGRWYSWVFSSFKKSTYVTIAPILFNCWKVVWHDL